MTKIRQKLAKVYIHSQDNGNDFGIIDHLAEVGYDVDFEVVDNGVGNKVISCEIYDAGGRKTMIKNNRTAMNECIQEDQRETWWGSPPLCSLRRSDGSGGR